MLTWACMKAKAVRQRFNHLFERGKGEVMVS